MYRIRVTGRASYKTLGPTWRKLSLSPRPTVPRTSQNRDWCSVQRACVNRAIIKTYYKAPLIAEYTDLRPEGNPSSRSLRIVAWGGVSNMVALCAT